MHHSGQGREPWLKRRPPLWSLHSRHPTGRVARARGRRNWSCRGRKVVATPQSPKVVSPPTQPHTAVCGRVTPSTSSHRQWEVSPMVGGACRRRRTASGHLFSSQTITSFSPSLRLNSCLFLHVRGMPRSRRPSSHRHDGRGGVDHRAGKKRGAGEGHRDGGLPTTSTLPRWSHCDHRPTVITMRPRR